MRRRWRTRLMPEQETDLWHLLIARFNPLCKADEKNQAMTTDLSNVTCVTCARIVDDIAQQAGIDRC